VTAEDWWLTQQSEEAIQKLAAERRERWKEKHPEAWAELERKQLRNRLSREQRRDS
jgi:hypothetical protein